MAGIRWKILPDYTDDASWGPRMTGQEYIPWYAWFPGHQYSFKTAPLVGQPDNSRDFWNTGVTSTTNAAFLRMARDILPAYLFQINI